MNPPIGALTAPTVCGAAAGFLGRQLGLGSGAFADLAPDRLKDFWRRCGCQRILIARGRAEMRLNFRQHRLSVWRIGIERRNHGILQRRFNHLVCRSRRRWFRVTATGKQQHEQKCSSPIHTGPLGDLIRAATNMGLN